MLVLPPKRVRGKKRDAGVAINPADNPLFEALRTCRRDLAKEAGVPPYVIFHDSVLREMAAQRPTSRSALMHLSGIGARKLEAYGDAFLEVIRAAG